MLEIAHYTLLGMALAKSDLGEYAVNRITLNGVESFLWRYLGANGQPWQNPRLNYGQHYILIVPGFGMRLCTTPPSEMLQPYRGIHLMYGLNVARYGPDSAENAAVVVQAHVHAHFPGWV